MFAIWLSCLVVLALGLLALARFVAARVRHDRPASTFSDSEIPTPLPGLAPAWLPARVRPPSNRERLARLRHRRRSRLE